jgi:hypothetical protein
MSSLLRTLSTRATRAKRRVARTRGKHMAEQTQQEPGINLGQTYGINTLIGSLMDAQQVIRNIPNLLAQLDALKVENDTLKAQLAELQPKATA